MSNPGYHDVHPELVNRLAQGILHKGWGIHRSGGCIGGPPLERVPTAWEWALAYQAVAEHHAGKRGLALDRCDRALAVADTALHLVDGLLDEREPV
jgi:hypothetical protein